MDRRGPGQAAESYPCRTAPGTGAGPAEVGGLEGPPGRARAAQARPGPMDSDARGPARQLGSTPPSRAWTGAGGVPDVPPAFPLRESRDLRPLSGRGARRPVQRLGCRPDTRPLSVPARNDRGAIEASGGASPAGRTGSTAARDPRRPAQRATSCVGDAKQVPRARA